MSMTPTQTFWAKVAGVVIVFGLLAWFLPAQYVIVKPKTV